MKRKITKAAVICASSLLAINFYSCNKNETNNSQVTQVNEDGIETVKFFEVEKGDSIAKGIFREKPDFDDDVVVIATSEDLLKGEAISGGSGYIYWLKTSVRTKNDAPATMTEGGRTYYKLGVDLNEGAGGKWIFLYYAKTNTISEALCDIACLSSIFPIVGVDYYWSKLGTSFGCSVGDCWTDLNEGAGGHYVKLVGVSQYFNGKYIGGTPIRDVAIISSSSSMSSWRANEGWVIESTRTDLNKGAGGKYIYLAFRK
ncbi:MAG: hypothetical protein FWC39_00075 [Bacteroidetes bacterium]|nr:hypothetical protein [Bacteroidota bacterium]